MGFFADRLVKVQKASAAVSELQEQLGRLHRDIPTMDRELTQKRVAELKGAVELVGGAGASRTPFTAGWRPLAGWICGLALGYQFVGRDILVAILLNFVENPVLPPELDTVGLLTVLGSLLGIGGLRTVEKVKGVAK